MRWLWFDYIPAELNVPKRDRRKIRQRAKQLRKRQKDYLGAEKKRTRMYFAIVLPLAVASVLLYTWARDNNYGGFASAIFIVYNILFAIALLWVFQRTHAPFIRRACCELGYQVCIKCGYPMIGLPAEVVHCPECGTYHGPRGKTKPPPMPDRSDAVSI